MQNPHAAVTLLVPSVAHTPVTRSRHQLPPHNPVMLHMYVLRSRSWSLTGCTQRPAQSHPETRALTPGNGSLGGGGFGGAKPCTVVNWLAPPLGLTPPHCNLSSPSLPPPPSAAMKQSDAVAKVTWGWEGAGLGGTDEVVCYLPTWLIWDEIWLCPGGTWLMQV